MPYSHSHSPSRPGFNISLMLVTAMLVVALVSACNTQSTRGASSGAHDASKLFIVDCLLPGQIRQLGSGTTYISPRRPIKTTAADCEIRGGEYVAYDRADYRTALNVWLPKAKAGDPEAQTYVGEIYEKGLGLPSDYEIAAIWYRRAAKQGFSRAQTNLGFLYEKGLGVEQDIATALNWYRKASGLSEDELQFASAITISKADKQALRKLRKQSAAQQREARRLKKQLAATRSQLRRQQLALKTTQRQAMHLRKQLQTPSTPAGQPESSGDREKLQRALREKERQLDEQSTTIVSLETRLSKQHSRLGEELRDTRQDARAKADTIAELRRELAARQAALDKARQDLEQRAGSRDRQPGERARERQLADARRQLESSNARLRTQQRELDKLKSKLQLRESKVNALRSELVQLQQARRKSSEQLDLLKRHRDQAIALREDISEKDAAIARLTQSLSGSQRKIEAMRDQLADLTPALQSEQKSLSAARSALEKSRKTLAAREKQVEELNNLLTGRDVELEQRRAQIRELQAQTRQYKQRLAEIEALQVADSSEGPVIEILDPPMVVTRGGVPAVRLRAGTRERRIIGKITAQAGLRKLTFNGIPMTTDDNGLFQHHVKVGRQRVSIKIAAIDRKGRQAGIVFYLEPKLRTARITPDKLSTEGFIQARPQLLRGKVDFGDYYALIIGNNDYEHYPKLETAIRDARDTEALLREKYGFRTTLLLNANRFDILSALAELRENLKENDNFLIYYAGHGELDRVNSRGHWLPVDARPNNPANWISNIAITDILNTMSAKHILVVADSCYSGAMTRTSIARLPPDISTSQKLEWLRVMTKARSRTVLTSGGLQPVLDQGDGGHSVFAKAFLDALADNKNVLEADKLYYNLFGTVQQSAAEYGISQRPEYAPIKYSGHEAGVFFFVPAG